jgi:hypothetical protein
VTPTISLLRPRAIGLLLRLVRADWVLLAGAAAHYFERYGAGAVAVRWSELERWARSGVDVGIYYVSPAPDNEPFHRAVSHYDPTREIVAFVGIDGLFSEATRSRLARLPSSVTGYGWFGVFDGQPPPPECPKYATRPRAG